MPLPFLDPGDDYLTGKGGGGSGAPGQPGPGPGGGLSGALGAGSYYALSPAYQRTNIPDALRRRLLGPIPSAGPSVGRTAQRYGASPAPTSESVGSGSWGASMPWLQPAGGGGSFTGLVGGAAGRTPGGGGSSFDPNNPWAQFSGDQRLDIPGLFDRLLGGAGQFGDFDPSGSKGIMDAIRQQFAGEAGNRYESNRASLMASPEGNDPSLMAFNSLASQLGTQSDLSKALSGAQTQQMTAYQDWIRALLEHALSQTQSREDQLLLQKHMPGQGGGLGGTLGSLGGMALGSFLGPAGSAFGGALGKRAFS